MAVNLSSQAILTHSLTQATTEQGRLTQIRQALSADGPELETTSDQKIILHLWGKLERTEKALKEEVAAVGSIILTYKL